MQSQNRIETQPITLKFVFNINTTNLYSIYKRIHDTISTTSTKHLQHQLNKKMAGEDDRRLYRRPPANSTATTAKTAVKQPITCDKDDYYNEQSNDLSTPKIRRINYRNNRRRFDLKITLLQEKGNGLVCL